MGTAATQALMLTHTWALLLHKHLCSRTHGHSCSNIITHIPLCAPLHTNICRHTHRHSYTQNITHSSHMGTPSPPQLPLPAFYGAPPAVHARPAVPAVVQAAAACTVRGTQQVHQPLPNPSPAICMRTTGLIADMRAGTKARTIIKACVLVTARARIEGPILNGAIATAAPAAVCCSA